MLSDTFEPQESSETRRIKTLADEAEALAKSLDLGRYPNIHISQALRGIPRGRERDYLFAQIKTELKRRGFKTPQEEDKEKQQLLREARNQLLLEDAYKHEARIDTKEREDDEEAA